MASNADTTINPKEAQHFGALADDWWNPGGASAMLHKLNPVRLRFIREAIDAHWGNDGRSMHPLAGKRALDVGCGAGLLCEPLARLGATVTGIDAATENIEAARRHAAGQDLEIDYCAGGIETLGMANAFDLVTSMEVIEHVTDPLLFLRGLADALSPDGLMVLSTPNRTALSRLAMITLGEGLNMIPRGTHDWDQFLKPDEMETMLSGLGLETIAMKGISFDPRFGLVLNDRIEINYIMSVRRARP